MARPVALARGAWRALCLLVLLLVALALAALVSISPRPIAPEPLMRWWMRQLLAVLRVRVRWQGARPAHAGLVVANHVSWLDIAVIASHLPTRFIAKQEVRAWPLIGSLAEAAGTTFIRRGSHGTRTLVDRLEPQLRTGGRVALFPEGTTTRGEGVRRFHPRLFALAARAGAPVQPIALRYARAPDGRALAPFVDDDAFLPHLLRLLAHPGLDVEAVITPALSVSGEREALARAARAAIAAALEGLQRDSKRADSRREGPASAGARLPEAGGTR